MAAVNPTTTVTDPLLPNDNDNSRAIVEHSAIEQTLNGKTYRIDTSQLLVKLNERNPLWKKALQTSVVIVATPILVPAVALYTFSMYVGPAWWRNKVTAAMVSTFMQEVGEFFQEERTELLKGIGGTDTVMDLGAGSGCYLDHLSQCGHLVAIEPCANFHDNYKKRAIEAGLAESQVELHACDLETYLERNPQKKETFDWIVLGNVLCEVDDQRSTLRCLNQLLKPKGHVYFSEHCGMPKGTWARWIQDTVNPLWRTAGAGCNCNRDSLTNIRNTPGWQVISWNYSAIKVLLGPFALGLAMKRNDAIDEAV